MTRRLTVIIFCSLLITPSLAAAPFCVASNTTCFPSSAELATFNSSINGRLFAPPPYGQVCYDGYFDAVACTTLVNNKTNAQFRETIPAAMMFTNNEFDQNGAGCPVPASVPTSPLTGPCDFGALGIYFVNATTSEDISLAVQFAAKHNLRLRVKNVKSFV